MNIFGRSKPIRATPLTTTSRLPANFAEKLLELETQLAYNLSVSLVSSLMQLYSLAIEYYESIQDKSFLYYKDRLSGLLSKKEVLQMLWPSFSPEKKIIEEPMKSTERYRSQEVRTGKRSPESANFNRNPSWPKKDVDSTIKDHLHESSYASSIVKESIKSQEGDRLQQRLQARKRAGSLKPQGLENEMKSEEKVAKVKMYQKAVEEVMEKFAELMVMKMKGIEDKYRLESLEEGGRMIKKEIEEMQVEVVKERKEQMRMLRNKFEGGND